MKSPKLHSAQIVRYSKQFQQCKTMAQLARLLNTDVKTLGLLAFSPLYFHFTVPKKEGDLRYIESPELELKNIQRKLNLFLQSFYYLHQSKAAFGYIVRPKDKPNTKNIKTNAEAHLDKTYMINADFEDFFHQITSTHVHAIFTGSYFRFDNHTAHQLTKICCYKERLPMGAPTSPVLSNIYTLGLDRDLARWAIKNKVVYTRYVDDLSFSSDMELSPTTFLDIERIANSHQLHFNPNKISFFGKDSVKQVTGLVLNKTVDISPLFYKELEHDLLRLKHTVETVMIADRSNNASFLRAFKQEVMGKINFIAAIEGYGDAAYNRYLNTYYEALEPNADLLVRWTKFSNYI